jgi:hypothetical protein
LYAGCNKIRQDKHEFPVDTQLLVPGIGSDGPRLAQFLHAKPKYASATSKWLMLDKEPSSEHIHIAEE